MRTWLRWSPAAFGKACASNRCDHDLRNTRRRHLFRPLPPGLVPADHADDAARSCRRFARRSRHKANNDRKAIQAPTERGETKVIDLTEEIVVIQMARALAPLAHR